MKRRYKVYMHTFVTIRLLILKSVITNHTIISAVGATISASPIASF